VNFVMSVATGILTVSLLDQAPPFVTQTVNRIVERTIETVAAAPAAVIQSPAPSNQDLVMAAISGNTAHTVAIYSGGTGTSTPAVAIGTYLPKARAIATAAQSALPKEALIEFADGSYISASLVRQGGGAAIYGFADNAVLPKVTASALVPASNLKLGETVLAVGVDGSAATGIVAKVSDVGIRTTLPNMGTGSAVVDLAGNLVGLDGGGTTPGLLISADQITTLLNATSTAATSTPAH
jgi:hypothetical protein